MCEKRNCGCNTPGNMMICYTKEPAQPCIGVNLTVNNTETIDGSDNTSMILEETNNISAFKDHLEFVNSPEPLSGLKKNVVLRLTTKFLTTIANIFKGRNIGTGASIYKGPVTEFGETFQEFKRLRSTDSIEFTDGPNEIIATVNENWLQDQFPEIPTINYPVTDGNSLGDGIPIFEGLNGTVLQFASLISDDFIITSPALGTVKINSPGGGSSSEYWYLDNTFTRPTNWNTPQNPKEIIDGIPVPNGTLNDPFITFDEFLLKVIGGTGSNINGPYSRVNPKNNAILRVLSNFETDKELEVNNCGIEITNNRTITYIGTEEYAVNTERLWDAMPKTGGVLDRAVNFMVGGEGRITNKYHAGVINHKTSVASTTLSKRCFLEIMPKGSGLNFIEAPNSSTYTLLTEGDGVTPFKHGGLQVQGSTQLPTTPLLRIKGTNSDYWGAVITGTKLSIQTNIQSHIEVDEIGGLTSSCDEVMYMMNSNYVGYETKLYTGKPGMTSDELELLAGRSLFFKPYEDRNVFTSKNGSTLRLERVSTLPDAREEIGSNSIFRLEGASNISCLSSFKELGGGSAISYVNSIGSGNIIEIYNASQSSYLTYFAKGDSTNNVNITLVNSQVNPVQIIKKNIVALNINTSGTFSTIKSKPINSNIIGYTDNANAVSAGLISGMLYTNTTTGSITQVI